MKASRLKMLLLNVAAVFSYLGFGMVSTGLTRSPEFFTPVWIPAGVSTLFALLWGRSVYSGILIGSILFHFYFHQDAFSHVINFGWFFRNFDYVFFIMVQCEIARRLLLDFARSSRFYPNPRNLLELTLRCALLALVLPLLTNFFYLLEDRAFSLSGWIGSLSRWWFGDFLGIICLIPMAVFMLQTKPNESRLVKVSYLSIVSIYLLGLVVGYRLIADREVRGVEERFQREVADVKGDLLNDLDELIGEIDLMKIRFLNDREMDPLVFEQQGHQILGFYPSVHSINWISFVEAKDFDKWESQILTRATDSEFASSFSEQIEKTFSEIGLRSYLLPISIIANAENDFCLAGVDVSEQHAMLLDRAVTSGSPHLTTRRLGETEQVEMQVFYPIESTDYQHLAETFDTGEFGLFHIILHMDDFVGSFWRNGDPMGMSMQLIDKTDPLDPIVLSRFVDDHVLDKSVSIPDENVIFDQSYELDIFNRVWELKVESTRTYLSRYHSSAPFYLLVGGLGVSFLLGIHTLSNYLRTRVIEATVEEKTSELNAAKTEAERFAHAKSEFLAVMSHEIRTPMNGMISTTEMLRKSLLSEEQTELANIIEMSSQTLLALINDILDFSKLEAGKTQLESEPFDPIEVARTVEATFRAKTKEKGIGFRIVLPEQTKTPVRLIGDRHRLLQILMNLVSNAVKFTSVGEVTLTTRIEALAGGDTSLIYEVNDSGIGISPEKQKELFEPFTQADLSSTRKYGGTGLGLAIVKRIVDLIEGEIDVESAQGSGALFRVKLVLKQDNAPVVIRKEGAVEVAGEQGAFKQKRVLLVEDNAQNQRIMKLLLKRFELVVDVAWDGVEAVNLFQPDAYDFIFMDCRLPNMDGFEASRRIRQMESNNQRVPIIALTASTYEGARDECIDSGMDDYITKPVTLQAISNTLTTWLKVENNAIEQSETVPLD